MTAHKSDDAAISRRTVLKHAGAATLTTSGLAATNVGAQTACAFRWEPKTCVETAAERVPIFEEPCTDEYVEILPLGEQATILERYCCEEAHDVFYYVEWCNPELPRTWVRQSDLVESEGCCGGCTFRWEPETCVETAAERVPIFEEPCTDEYVEILPPGEQATILERYCCEENGVEYYYVEWCDPAVPRTWVRQVDLTESKGCCGCEFDWEPETCVETVAERAPIYEEPCTDEVVTYLPAGEQARILEHYCCEETLVEYYYVEWCDPDVPRTWVRQSDLAESEGCCGCEFRWEPETCVETAARRVPIFEEPCTDEVVTYLPAGEQATILDQYCCEEEFVEYYYVEWCNPELPRTWVHQSSLIESEGCCGCEFDWEPETCVETAAERVPIFERPCTDEYVEILPPGEQGIILERYCCEEDLVEYYFVEWCDPTVPPTWVRQADLIHSEDCCGCEFNWGPETCVETVADRVPIFVEPCTDEVVTYLSAGEQATILDQYCCEEEFVEYYYVEWCNPELPRTWIRQPELVESEGCCGCEFRWEPETCVETVADRVPIFVEPCSEEVVTYLQANEQATILDQYCCEEEFVEYYYVEWCNPELPRTWVRQSDLVESVGCCGCEFDWEPETCVETAAERVPIFVEPCTDEYVEILPPGEQARILEAYCCEEDFVEYYYVEWCNPELPRTWVRQADLAESEDCCGGCTFKWEPETCVETATERVPIFEEPCTDEVVTYLPTNEQATILERYCCEEGFVEYYYVEWCNPELPRTWVRQSDLVESEGCCGGCTFHWEPETCVETAAERVPIFEEPCTDEYVEILPPGEQGIILEPYCCEEGGVEYYFVEWCHPELPGTWVRQADVVESERCCDDV